MSPKKVILYSTPFCTYCRLARKFLEKHGVPYEEYDVSSNAAAREEMVHRSHQLGVPVIEVDGEIFVGFNPALLKRALGID
jgi:glutaredoxin-like YruB-family protein